MPLLRFADHIPDALHNAIRNAPHVRRWLDHTATRFDLHEVLIRDVGLFGERVGFVFLEADVRHEGKRIPKYAFLRGDAAAALIVLRCEGEPDRTLLTCEPRLPIAYPNFLSLPAGMLDGGEFASTMLRELGEEIGADLPVKADDLIELTRYWPSPGGCDEAVAVFYAELDVSPELIAKLDNRATGNAAEHENIHVRVIKLDDLPHIGMTDAKTLLGYHLYKARKAALA
ncbi:NUDIX domain-containing protein [Kozakia baliensis]|uniref:NUDIX domain-containing protein n=1 Tax=Kozakia baliensis TaxID=153496 RepID=UPI00345BCC8B